MTLAKEMRFKRSLLVVTGFCLFATGIAVSLSYQRSVKVALDTYENELGISQNGFRMVAVSPQAAQEQVQSPIVFWAGLLIAAIGFYTTSINVSGMLAKEDTTKEANKSEMATPRKPSD